MALSSVANHLDKGPACASFSLARKAPVSASSRGENSTVLRLRTSHVECASTCEVRRRIRDWSEAIFVRFATLEGG